MTRKVRKIEKIINESLKTSQHRHKKEKLLKYLVGVVILLVLIGWVFWIINSDSWSGHRKESNTLIKGLQEVSNEIGSDIFEFKTKSKQEIDKAQVVEETTKTEQKIIDDIKEKIKQQSEEIKNSDIATTTSEEL